MEKQSESASCTGLLGEKDQPKIQGERHRGKHKLSVCSKICFAIGGAPYQITGCALGFFLQMYLLDVVQMSPFNASIILFTGRVWDAITDPLVGFFVSRSSWTPFGRLVPWIILSTPFAVICYFLIWYVPDISSGQLVWYLTFYCLFQTLVTCFHVPYSALTMFISKEQSDRDSATGYRMTVEVLGTVLGTAIQGQIVGNVDDTCVPNSLQGVSVNTSVASVEESIVSEDSGSLTNTRVAYLIAAGIICGIYILCAVVLSFGVREKRESCELLSEQSVSFWQGLKLVMSHRPYIKLIAGFLFTSLAFMEPAKSQTINEQAECTKLIDQLGYNQPAGFTADLSQAAAIATSDNRCLLPVETAFPTCSCPPHGENNVSQQLLEGNFALFLKYTLQRRKDYHNILLVIMISATLTVPFWQWFLTRFGKKTAVYIGISSVIPFMIVAGLVKINVIVTYIVAIAAGLSVAAAFLLPWSMLPDVIDDFILKNPESPGHEAIFFSFYVFFTKFASGVSLGISTLSLDYAGYQARSCYQPEAVNVTLRLLVCAAPIVLILIGLLLFKLYPIDEEKRKENRKALQLIRENDRDSDSDSVELASNL